MIYSLLLSKYPKPHKEHSASKNGFADVTGINIVDSVKNAI
jgi:hypothetical protein